AAKITTFERSLAPNDKPGRGGQVLTITVEASLIGTSIPGNILSLSVSGGATIKAETGNRVLPREEEAALDDALAGAFKSALDDAATKLRTKSKKKGANERQGGWRGPLSGGQERELAPAGGPRGR